MNLLDRLITSVAPSWGASRASARVKLAAAQHAEGAIEAFSGTARDGAPSSPSNARWSVVPRSSDADTLRGLPRQRGESRELRRTNPIAAGAIQTNLNRVVGTGLVPVPDFDLTILRMTEEESDALKEVVAREFSFWADSHLCTIEGNETFYERQATVLGARLDSGDCFTLLPDASAASPLMPYLLRMQLIEADRVGNPAGQTDTNLITAGIKRNDFGTPIAAHVYKRHPGSNVMSSITASALAGDWIEYVGNSGRRRILHHYRPTRPEQTRGNPYLGPVIQAIKDLGRYTEAEITAAVVSAFFTVFIEQDSGGPSPAPIFGGQAMDATPNQDAAAPEVGAEMAMAPAAMIGLAKGEKATFADPKRPNVAYEPFVNGVLTLVAIGLHLPRELLLKKFDASFSASKAALLDAWHHFKTERSWLVNSFCQPVYETWFAEAVAIGRIKAPGFFSDPLIRWAYTRAAWHGDSQGSINPKDEVAAYREAIDARLMTHERAEWELFGSDWNRTFATKVREIARMKKEDILPAARAGAAPSKPQEPTA